MQANKPKIGKFITQGTCGDVFEIEGDKSSVIKVPIGYMNGNKSSVQGTAQDVLDEARTYKRLKLALEPIFTHMKVIKLAKLEGAKGNYVGLIKSRITPVSSKVTVAQIEQLRRKVINLSHKGFIFKDKIEVGTDSNGNLSIYDTGFIKKGDPEDAFDINNSKWERLTKEVSRMKGKTDYSVYGFINQREKY